MYYKNRHNKHVDYHKSETNKYGTRQVLQIDMLYFINTVFCIVHSKLQKYRKAWNIKFTMFGDSSFQRMNKKKSFFLWISKCDIIYNLLDIFAHYVLSTTLKLYICKVQTTVFSSPRTVDWFDGSIFFVR